MPTKTYYSRDLRGFVSTISPLLYFVRKSIASNKGAITSSEREALLVLIDLVELRTSDQNYEIHSADIQNASDKETRLRGYLRDNGTMMKIKKERQIAGYGGELTPDFLQKPIQDRDVFFDDL